MFRRSVRLLLVLCVLNVSGCALLDVALYPVKLLFSLLGAAGSAVGLAGVTPVEGPAPVVQELGGERWLVTDLSPGAPCAIVCSAPGFETRTFAWPRDFAGRGEDVAVRLERTE